HYTGMAAAEFDPRSICTAVNVFNLGNFQLGILIAVVMLSILSVTLMASVFDSRLASQTVKMLRSVEAANRGLKHEIQEHARVQVELEAEVESHRKTERQLEAAVENLYRSNEELEQFAYVASHDLQAPLRAIIGFTQLLGTECKGKLSPDAEEFLGFIEDGGKRMQAIIRDLLELSRIGKDNEPPRAVSVGDALERARKQMRLDIKEKNVQLQVGELPEVMGSDSQITQLLQNLIGNAIKYTAAGVTPEVHISASREGDQWHFVVEDNGIGIAEEHLRAVFVIFRRLHANDKYPGTGIGLSLCKKIVARHGGEIWVESTLGQGSRFNFTLPAVDAEQPMTAWPQMGSAAIEAA
ncbi:MAG: sensor histidine kinase, partial [Nevskiales bacterium]